MSRKVKTLWVIVVSVFLFFCIYGALRVKPQIWRGKKDLQEVNFQLSWMEDSLNFAPFYWGKSIFEKHGLKVNIVCTREGSPFVMKMLSGHQAQFGYATPSYIITAINAVHDKGGKLDVKIVAPAMREVPGGFVFRKGLKPQDIHRVAIKLNSVHHLMARLFFKKMGIPSKQIEWVPVAGGWDGIKRFMSDKSIDATFTYIDGMMNIERQGIPFDFMLLSDGGIKLFGDSIVADMHWASKHPDIAKRFVAAVMEISEYAKSHPEKIMDYYFHRYPSKLKDRKLVTKTFKRMIGLFTPEKIRSSEFADAIALLRMTGQIKGNLPLDLYYTNDYLP